MKLLPPEIEDPGIGFIGLNTGGRWCIAPTIFRKFHPKRTSVWTSDFFPRPFFRFTMENSSTRLRLAFRWTTFFFSWRLSADYSRVECKFWKTTYIFDLPPTQHQSPGLNYFSYLVGTPYKPLSATVTGWGVDLMYVCESWKFHSFK